VIQFLHVSRRYDRGGVALADVTLSIEGGEFVFLTGPSGAGKSTLLRLVFREEPPSEGRVLVFGRNLRDLSEAEVMRYRRDVGFVFQDFKLLPDKTVFENLTFVLRALGVRREERRQGAFDALKRMGLHHRMHSLPRELSGGEQQRVAIARALIDSPRLLLADEPTGSLDPELAANIMELFKEVNARGTTIIVASHDREMIRALRKRTVVLEAGRVMSDGPFR
jgi:cell division transport system ATP-binding protein